MISITHEPAGLWQQAPHSTLMKTSGQGCGFTFHQGNAHGQDGMSGGSEIFPVSALRLPPAAGFRKRPGDPHTHMFIHSSSSPHRAPCIVMRSLRRERAQSSR